MLRGGGRRSPRGVSEAACKLARMGDLEAIRAEVERLQGAYVEALREMVNIDCGTYTPAGVNRIADVCAGRFGALGYRVDRREHRPAPGEPQLGDCVIGHAPPETGPRILMIGHMDTVFGEGTAAEPPHPSEGTSA